MLQLTETEDWVNKIKNSEQIDASMYVKDHDIQQISQKWAELYNSLVIK